MLVLSTPPGFTAKWLAPRLYRFANANPEIDVRVSSSFGFANFTTDGVDVAVRNLPSNAASDSVLVVEKLADVSLVPVCSPRLIAAHGLWERATDRRVREQAILFNLVTVITVAIGILALYAAVCVLSLAAVCKGDFRGTLDRHVPVVGLERVRWQSLH